jgi:hypothetical protein
MLKASTNARFFHEVNLELIEKVYFRFCYKNHE